MNKLLFFGCVAALAASAASAASVSDAEKNCSLEMNAGPAARIDRSVVDGVRVLFLGNSITLHRAAPQLGWTNVCGMAASRPENDYVHLVTRGIEAKTGRMADVRVRNVADFERNFRTWDVAKELADDIAFRPDYLIVAVGENVEALSTEADRHAYRAAFKRLLESFTYGRMKPHVAVRGVFWPNAAKDAEMAHAASDLAMPFVRTDDLGQDEAMKATGRFSHPGVAAHPGDRGMAATAGRVLEVFFPKDSGYAAWVDGQPVVEDVTYRDIRIEADGSEEQPIHQLNVEDVAIYCTNGAPEPVKRVSPQPGTSFGTLTICEPVDGVAQDLKKEK